MRIAVHPDVIDAAQCVIRALNTAEKEIPDGYHLEGPVFLCIDAFQVATIEWHEDAWHLIPIENESLKID